MIGILIMFSGMQTLRRVTTANVATNQAHTQSDPVSTLRFTLFAACSSRNNIILIYTNEVFATFVLTHVKAGTKYDLYLAGMLA
jgi:hypothetical protein